MSGICIRQWTSEYILYILAARSLKQGRYSLIQIFSKFGKVSKLDFLFHKTGPLKGKPRGYAFVQYANQEVRMVPQLLRPVLTPDFLHHCGVTIWSIRINRLPPAVIPGLNQHPVHSLASDIFSRMLLKLWTKPTRSYSVVARLS
jgi:hypothetical protein